VIAQEQVHVVSESIEGSGISAADAYEAAGISYRQLDHWARQGWVRPSISAGEGRSGKRLYAPVDIVRLSLLRHLAQSKVNASTVGPLVAGLEIQSGDVRIIWGPVGAKDPETVGLVVVDATAALEYLEQPGAFVVFDPGPAWKRALLLTTSAEPPSTSTAAVSRRSA
jgi:DNA-binding transcriptional MerR regulator